MCVPLLPPSPWNISGSVAESTSVDFILKKKKRRFFAINVHHHKDFKGAESSRNSPLIPLRVFTTDFSPERVIIRMTSVVDRNTEHWFNSGWDCGRVYCAQYVPMSMQWRLGTRRVFRLLRTNNRPIDVCACLFLHDRNYIGRLCTGAAVIGHHERRRTGFILRISVYDSSSAPAFDACENCATDGSVHKERVEIFV